MRKSAVVLTLLILLVTVAGCGTSLSEMSPEDNEMVSEYSVSLLLKYDSENHSRLVDTSQFLNNYNFALQVREDSINSYNEKIIAEEELRKEETLLQEELLNGTEEELLQDTVKDDEYGGATVIDYTQPSMSIESYLGIPNYSISYSGYSLVDSYPEDGTDFFFSMDAATSKKLLVVKFNVTNNGSDGTLDIFSQNVTFKLDINGKGLSSVYKTMLEDDLSEYLGDFSAGQTKELVLIYEVPEGIDINSISLGLYNKEKGSIVNALLY